MTRAGSAAAGLALLMAAATVPPAAWPETPRQAAPSRGRTQALLDRIRADLGDIGQALARLRSVPPPAGSGAAFSGRYVVKGATHTFNQHELAHVVQQRAHRIQETADEVLVLFVRGDARPAPAARELTAAAGALRAAADRLATARDPKANEVAMEQVTLAHERVEAACGRVAKVDAFTIKQTIK
jgi:hypothetical protein